MRKGFLFGLGVLIAGGVLAATISTVSITNKTPGDTVTNQEFNSITAGLESLTDTFNGTISDATSITLPKEVSTTRLSTPEICLDSDCKAAWPTGGGTSLTAVDCPSGQQLQSVTADGSFTCGTDISGTGADLTSVDTDILPEMTGATPLMGNPPGSPSVVSVRNIGSATKWFKELWVEDLHVGNQTLYLNGVAVLQSDPMIEMKFTADSGQKMSISTFGDGAEMAVHSSDNLNLGITDDAADDKALTITNNSTDGTIDISTLVGATSSSKISVNSNSILLGSQPFSKTGVNLLTGTTPAYTLDVNGDINFTGTLYQNGVAFSGGGSSSTPWTVGSGQITYNDGNVGVKVTTPAAELEVGGAVLANKFCLDTGTTDVCTTKTCTDGFTSGPDGATCFSQSTLTAIQTKISEPTPTSYWDAVSLGSGIYTNAGNVGIGTNNPRDQLTVKGDVSIDADTTTGDYGSLTVAGSIQVGGYMCPAAGAACANAGEIASCGAGGQILACAGASSQWMPITSHNGTIVGSTSDACSAANAGTMRFLDGTTQSLQICMKLSGSSTYGWRTILSGGGATA